jgi:hypothetical protein
VNRTQIPYRSGAQLDWPASNLSLVASWRATRPSSSLDAFSTRVWGSGEPVVSTIVRSTTVPFRRAIDESVVA